MAYNEDSSASGHDEPWIQWFCGLKGHEMFCQVERAYIEDGFNLYGLRACVSNFSDCLDLILDRIGPEDSDDSHLTQSACTLYGLIHARYIVTTHGLDSMYNKYAAKEFGTCPLVQCNGQPVLPVGLRDEIGVDTAKIFCPKCKSVYQPPPIRSRSGHHSSNSGGGGAVDGAAFGTTFPHLFLMTFNNLVPDPLPPNSAYIPRVFGFRVHQSAHRQGGNSGSYPAMSNNGRRGGASYAQRMANMTSTRASGGGTRGGGGVVPVQNTTTGVVKADKGAAAAVEAGPVGGTAGKAVTLTPKPSKKTGNDDGAAAAAAIVAAEGAGVGDGAKEKATLANDGGDGNSNSSKKRAKSDGGKNSGSSNENGANKSGSLKRQKRGADVT
ncbi:hypothetical protein ACHAXR_004345 [Thalassiosira sp. AJA248-18]